MCNRICPVSPVFIFGSYFRVPFSKASLFSSRHFLEIPTELSVNVKPYVLSCPSYQENLAKPLFSSFPRCFLMKASSSVPLLPLNRFFEFNCATGRISPFLKVFVPVVSYLCTCLSNCASSLSGLPKFVWVSSNSANRMDSRFSSLTIHVLSFRRFVNSIVFFLKFSKRSLSDIVYFESENLSSNLSNSPNVYTTLVLTAFLFCAFAPAFASTSFINTQFGFCNAPSSLLRSFISVMVFSNFATLSLSLSSRFSLGFFLGDNSFLVRSFANNNSLTRFFSIFGSLSDVTIPVPAIKF